MLALFFTCPKTNQRAPTSITSWSKKFMVDCPLCGGVHEFADMELSGSAGMSRPRMAAHIARLRRAPAPG